MSASVRANRVAICSQKHQGIRRGKYHLLAALLLGRDAGICCGKVGIRCGNGCSSLIQFPLHSIHALTRLCTVSRSFHSDVRAAHALALPLQCADMYAKCKSPAVLPTQAHASTKPTSIGEFGVGEFGFTKRQALHCCCHGCTALLLLLAVAGAAVNQVHWSTKAGFRSHSAKAHFGLIQPLLQVAAAFREFWA